MHRDRRRPPDQRWRLDGLDLGEGVGRAQRLRRGAGLARVFLDVGPACRALRIGAAVGQAQFDILTRQPVQAGDRDPAGEVGQQFFRERTGAGADDQATQVVLVPGGIVQSREAAAGDTEQKEAVELEGGDQGVEIAGDAAGLRSVEGSAMLLPQPRRSKAMTR